MGCLGSGKGGTKRVTRISHSLVCHPLWSCDRLHISKFLSHDQRKSRSKASYSVFFTISVNNVLVTFSVGD